MNRRSIWAIVAGVLVVIVVTTLVDVVLHLTGVYQMKQRLTDALALLATSYRVVIGIAAGWLTARLAPRDPMRHAMILGGIGSVLGLVGLIATWNLDLGPRWYPIALVVLAIPQSWAGGRLFERQPGSP
jgi:uncharacterized membrane protein